MPTFLVSAGFCGCRLYYPMLGECPQEIGLYAMQLFLKTALSSLLYLDIIVPSFIHGLV